MRGTRIRVGLLSQEIAGYRRGEDIFEVMVTLKPAIYTAG